MKLTGTSRAPKHRVLAAAVTVALAVGATPALAWEYTNGDFSLTTSNTISYGVQSRMQKPAENLIGKANLFTPNPAAGVLFPAQLPNAFQVGGFPILKSLHDGQLNGSIQQRPVAFLVGKGIQFLVLERFEFGFQA